MKIFTPFLAFIFLSFCFIPTVFGQVPFRMNVGADGPYNFSGIVFQVDDGGFETSKATNTSDYTGNVGNTTYDALYQNYKFVDPWTISGNTSATWNKNGFPANTTYTVHLHFCEIYFNNPKGRVFDVMAMGLPFASDVDVFDMVGGDNYLVLSGAVTTDNLGNINITLQNGFADNGMLAAIEIVNVGTPEFHLALPIELVSFQAEVIADDVQIDWATANEAQNHYFSVERSIDGDFFQEIARVDGAGNSVTERKYQVTDNTPPSGLVYYRLRQTDFDGTTTHSNTVEVILEGFTELQIMGNPVTDQTIRFRVPNNKRALGYALKDLHGRTLHTGSLPGELSHYDIQVPGLPIGIYQLTVTGAFGIKRQNILIK